MAARIELTWPAEGATAGKLDAPGMEAGAEAIDGGIRALTPHDDTQRYLQSKAMQIGSDLMRPDGEVDADAFTSAKAAAAEKIQFPRPDPKPPVEVLQEMKDAAGTPAKRKK